jgi:hypothetical protein
MNKTEEAVQKFIRQHGSKFDYSKVDYINAKTKVIVICKTHGEFLITPNNHITGYGCAKCTGKGFTVEEKLYNFLKQAEEIHGDRYSYDKVNITDSKLCITCPIHGDFLQSKLNHITGKNGCPECAKKQRGLANMLTLDEFIIKARKTHGGRYNYSNAVYTGAHNKLLITCTSHGDFEVTPVNHWSNGVGCPNCFSTKSSLGERTIRDWLIASNILYECQKTFTDLYHLKKNAKLKYDFFLPKLNTLIEYDGEYHYKPISYSSTIKPEEQLAVTQARDKLKTEYAARNGIYLLRIRFDDDIISILEAKITKSGQRDQQYK